MKRGSAAGQKLQGFSGFEGGNQVHDGAENTDGVAGFLKSHVRGGFEKTGKAGSLAREDGHGNAVAGHRRGINPGCASFDGKIVDEEARLKVVRAVQDERKIREQLRGVSRGQVGHNALDLDVGIDGAELPFGGDRFRQCVSGIGFVKESLSLQIGGLDKVTVQDSEAADSCADEQICDCSADGSAANQDGASSCEALLAVTAEGPKQHLARVFQVEGVVHVK